MNMVRRPWAWLAVALVFAAIYLFPLYWMYVTAVKSPSEIFASPPTFWPKPSTARTARSS